jgi:hypothetical protein
MYTYDNNGNKVQMTENYDDAQAVSPKMKKGLKYALYVIAVILLLIILWSVFMHKKAYPKMGMRRYGFEFF